MNISTTFKSLLNPDPSNIFLINLFFNEQCEKIFEKCNPISISFGGNKNISYPVNSVAKDILESHVIRYYQTTNETNFPWISFCKLWLRCPFARHCTFLFCQHIKCDDLSRTELQSSFGTIYNKESWPFLSISKRLWLVTVSKRHFEDMLFNIQQKNRIPDTISDVIKSNHFCSELPRTFVNRKTSDN